MTFSQVWRRGAGLVSLVLTLAGCGGGAQDPSDSAAEAATETAQATYSWVTVAVEGASFTTVGSQLVRYGAGTQWVRQDVSGTAVCSSAYFGSDPAPGVANICQARVDTSVPVGPGEYRWSDASTWGGRLPGAGAAVVIPAGRTVILDVDTAALGALQIDGTLRFAQGRNLALTARSIRVSGALLIGTAAEPYAHRAVITLNGAPAAVNDGVSRGLLVEGGMLRVFAASPQPAWTKLDAHAASGARSMTLAAATDWRAGQQVVVAPTEFYGRGDSQRLVLDGAEGSAISTVGRVSGFRWGRLQYMTRDGLSLTPDPDYVPPARPAPTLLDERAVVANLSRGVVIQAPDDTHWRDLGFGAHVMVMGLQSRVIVDGVEFRRVGQAGVLGRYPFHWHMLSYSPSTGVLLGDADGHVIRNSSVWDSANRCIVVHGTNGVRVVNNICYDIRGHAYFLEDGSERRNVFERNVALKVRAPAANRRLQVHESERFQSGPSGFWLTNPDNTVRNNHAGDTAGNGFWMSYPRAPLGLSARVAIRPDRLQHGPFEQNVAHSNRGPGFLLDWIPVDAAGNLTTNLYIPTLDGSNNTAPSNLARFELRRITSYKNLDGAYRNRSIGPSYIEWTTADNVGTHFSGAGDFGLITRGLAIGYSLNNRTAYPGNATNEMPVAYASYHSTFDLRSNVVVNFPFVDGLSSGAFKTNDYYLLPVDKGLFRNSGNRLVNSHAGYRMSSPNIDAGSTSTVPLAGALWDAHGYWGQPGNFWVYDLPFYTAGGNCTAVEPAGRNGMSCAGQFFGIYQFQTDFDNQRYLFTSPLEAVRLDAGGAEIGRWTLSAGNSVVDHFQHFAARNGGRYVVRFPGRPLPRWLAFSVSNAYRSGDSVLLAVSFDGSVNVGGYTVSGFAYARESANQPQYMRHFQPAASLAEVVASGGDRLWQDRANNLVWIRIQGGLPYPNLSSLPANSDEALYRPLSVVLRPR